MRKSLLLALPAAALLAFIFPPANRPSAGQRPPTAATTTFRCSPAYNPLAGSNSISPLTGWGNYHWKINTTADSAQFYFNQGISMYYAFHIIEARASFAKVTELDPQCALGWWALALSFGPNINDFEYTAPPDALAAARKAQSLSNFYTPKEKALVYAINTRYSAGTSQSRESLNKAYAAAMKQAFKDLPGDADIATLYADALLLLHPWDLYHHDFTPKPWTPEIVQVLEKALKLNPNNPGANHYYIHAVEASANPGRALPSANRLPALMPDVAHLVHMPSHIYIRTGHYAKGASLNQDAIKGYQKYLQAFPEVEGNAPLYSIHNLHMETICSQMAGHAAKSALAADKTRQSVPAMYLSIPGPMGHYLQYIHSTPALTMVRFGKWNDILSQQMPDSLPYAGILLHFARGMAFARTGQATHATYELTRLRIKMNEDESLRQPFTPFNPAYSACQVAAAILAGAVSEASGNLTEAIHQYQKGVALEDAMIYNEPKDWTLPVRHYLGNALLKAKRYTEAAMVFEDDLRINPQNGWALTGLHQAQLQQNKTTQAALTAAALKKAFAGSDMDIKAPVF